MNEKIIDYVTGKLVNNTPEERESVQPLIKELVDNLNYPLKTIRSHPQYKVKSSPSDPTGRYSVDIAVMDGKTPYIIAECKRKNKTDGMKQLEIYLNLSEAEIGIWDNGVEREIVFKDTSSGKIKYVPITSIPFYKEDVYNIGSYKKSDLKIPHNLKNKFWKIRNYLAANNIGATRDEVIAEQMIYILFIKIFDERYSKRNDLLRFTIQKNDTKAILIKRIRSIWEELKVKQNKVISKSDKISLDKESMWFIVSELQQFSLMNAERDVISDAFESFVGHSLKGEQGQFFTPRNVIKMIIEIIDPSAENIIFDPSCGTGSFLIAATKYVWEKIKTDSIEHNWSDSQVQKFKEDFASNNIKGVDKDSFLAKVSKAHMMVIGDGSSGIFNDSSLISDNQYIEKFKGQILPGEIDIIITNPPFGSKIKIEDKNILKNYELAFKKYEKGNGSPINTVPQTLFIEKYFNLLKNNGIMAVILPDAILGNKTSVELREWISNRFAIEAIIDLPLETFMPNTGTKTSVVIARKSQKWNEKIFFARPKTCGHNRRGEKIDGDDVSLVSSKYKEFKNANQ